MMVVVKLELADSHRVFQNEHFLDNLEHNIHNYNQQCYVDNSRRKFR